MLWKRQGSCEIGGIRHPFAYKLLQTDGCQLLLDAGEHYENVARRQKVFSFAEQFFKNIEFRDHLAQRWWPLGSGKLIVIDPERSFGAPIDARRGVRTEVLYRATLRKIEMLSRCPIGTKSA